MNPVSITVAPASTFFVTMALAPMVAPSPTVIGPSTEAHEPRVQPLPTRMPTACLSFLPVAPRVTPCKM